MDIFEAASRKKLRFVSERGEITTEQLWDLSLTSRTKFDLDHVAQQVARELRGVTEESFVQIKPDPRKSEIELKLEVVKHVIAVRVAEIDKQKERAAKAEKRAKLLDALSIKENEEIAGKSKEDILKELAEIDEAA